MKKWNERKWRWEGEDLTPMLLGYYVDYARKLWGSKSKRFAEYCEKKIWQAAVFKAWNDGATQKAIAEKNGMTRAAVQFIINTMYNKVILLKEEQRDRHHNR